MHQCLATTLRQSFSAGFVVVKQIAGLLMCLAYRTETALTLSSETASCLSLPTENQDGVRTGGLPFLYTTHLACYHQFMSARLLIHSIVLIASAVLAYIWTLSPNLSLYTLQLIAVLILIYFATHFIRKRRPKEGDRAVLTIDLIILTLIILLLITQTGALDSPFFFTIYFLLFATSLLFELESTLILTSVLLGFFALEPSTNLDNPLHLAHLLSLPAIMPLAIFTAHEYEKAYEERHLRLITQSHLAQQETDALLFLSLNLKRTLAHALDNLSVIIPQAKVKEVRENLDILYQDLKNLYRSADELQEVIDKETDEE